LDHLIVFNEANLRRVLSAIADEFPAFVGDAPPRRTMRALTLRSSMQLTRLAKTPIAAERVIDTLVRS